MPDGTDLDALLKLVKDFCSVEQISSLLRVAKDSGDVRVSAPTKDVLIQKNLRDALTSKAVLASTVMDLIREAEENGSQHVFYFRYFQKSGLSMSMVDIATRLWGRDWENKMSFPRLVLVPGDFIYADLHPWNEHLKPTDWVLKIYGQETVEKPTGVVEVVDENRLKREFVKEERRIVVVVRWNHPDLLEVRVPQTDSKKRIKAWVERTWIMISAALSPALFQKWDLEKPRHRMVLEQAKHKNVYKCSNTRVLDADHNVASFETHDPQSNLFASENMVYSVNKLIGDGECTQLRVTWIPWKNALPSRELNTLVGHNESNELVIGGHCSSKDVDYVTDQLRRFSK